MWTEAINLGQRLFMDSDGYVHPIVAMFDCDGEECSPPDAVVAVAGTEGRWFSINVADFEL